MSYDSMDFARELLSEYPPIEFRYDAPRKLFVVDDAEVEPSELLPIFRHKSDNPKPFEHFLQNVPIAIGTWDLPLMLPKFREYLCSVRENDFEQTAQTMYQLYQQLLDEPLDYSLCGDALFGFDVGWANDVGPRLNVLGNCACLGLDPSAPTFDVDDWENGIGEFTFHNIDSEVQKISLYAGIGHLATLATDQN